MQSYDINPSNLRNYSELVEIALTQSINSNSISIQKVAEQISIRMAGLLSNENKPNHIAMIMGVIESLVAYCRLNNIKLTCLEDYTKFAINVHEVYDAT